MIEAKITCLCRDISLTEWSLDLVEGDVVWLPASEARSSEELRRCVRNKALKLEYVERVRKMNKKAPTSSNLFPLGRRVVPKRRWASDSSPGETITSPPPHASVDTALLKEIRSLRQTCERLADAVESLAEQQVSLPETLREALEGVSMSVPQVVVESQPQSFSPKGSSHGKVKVESEPVFIPSGLVDKTQSVSVESAADVTAELGDSIAQLRALRGRRARQDEE